MLLKRPRSLNPFPKVILPVAVLLALALASAAAVLFILRSGQDTAPPPPYISGQSDNFLTRAQAMTHLRGYLATTLWAETAYVAALDHPGRLLRTLHSSIPLHCAQPSGHPTGEQARFLECARRSAAAAPQPPHWPSMPIPARTEAANRMLSNLWRATDPVERIRLTILWQEGVDPTDAPSIQTLQQQYDHCPEAMISRRHRLVSASSSQDLAKAWLSIADQLEDCADRASNRLSVTDPEAKPRRTPTPAGDSP